MIMEITNQSMIVSTNTQQTEVAAEQTGHKERGLGVVRSNTGYSYSSEHHSNIDFLTTEF